MASSAESTTIGDVRKTVTVPVGADEAWRIFVEHPMEWWPAHHVFVEERCALTIEPRVGGRYYEQGADGSVVDWGRIVEWDAPRRLTMTWRMGPGWRPVHDDDAASLIVVEVTALDDDHAEVALTHAALERHGSAAAAIHAALDGPSPGATLEQYAQVVARRSGGPA